MSERQEQIIVTVAGGIRSGLTSTCDLIVKTLREAGIEVEQQDLFPAERRPSDQLALNKKIQGMVGKTRIKVIESRGDWTVKKALEDHEAQPVTTLTSPAALDVKEPGELREKRSEMKVCNHQPNTVQDGVVYPMHGFNVNGAISVVPLLEEDKGNEFMLPDLGVRELSYGASGSTGPIYMAVKTAALRTGIEIPILMLTENGETTNKGFTDPTDMVAQDAHIAAVIVAIPSPERTLQFFRIVLAPYGRADNHPARFERGSSMVNFLSSGESLGAEWIDVKGNGILSASPTEKIKFQLGLEGRMNPHVGLIRVSGELKMEIDGVPYLPDTDLIQVVGYELELVRFNPNRRPRPI